MARSNRSYARRCSRWWRRDDRVRWFEIESDPLPGILKYLMSRRIAGAKRPGVAVPRSTAKRRRRVSGHRRHLAEAHSNPGSHRKRAQETAADLSNLPSYFALAEEGGDRRLVPRPLRCRAGPRSFHSAPGRHQPRTPRVGRPRRRRPRAGPGYTVYVTGAMAGRPHIMPYRCEWLPTGRHPHDG
jgi:hypothetical protein